MKIFQKPTMLKHLRNLLSLATTEEIEAGKLWYREARAFASSVASDHGYSVEQIAQVISVLSPQTSWQANKDNTISLIKYGMDAHIYATKSQKARAKYIK